MGNVEVFRQKFIHEKGRERITRAQHRSILFAQDSVCARAHARVRICVFACVFVCDNSWPKFTRGHHRSNLFAHEHQEDSLIIRKTSGKLLLLTKASSIHLFHERGHQGSHLSAQKHWKNDFWGHKRHHESYLLDSTTKTILWIFNEVLLGYSKRRLMDRTKKMRNIGGKFIIFAYDDTDAENLLQVTGKNS